MLSPLAPTSHPTLPAIAGVRLAAGNSGSRYKSRPDLLLAELSEGTTIAGVLTRSLAASAAVEACRQSLKTSKARGLIVNAGNANAFTGKAGDAAVKKIMKAGGKLLSCREREIFTASTGVIGETLPHEKITAMLPLLKKQLSAAGWEEAARTIMTTDTFPKMATRTAKIGGKTVTLNGIAKGSGMIAPDMATLLAFVFTDAKIPARALQKMLREANETTFNCITVDGDTSTSDTLLLFATGQAKNPAGSTRDFARALYEILHELAVLVVKDGEGAEKFITISVSGGASEKAARKIGLSIANSPLVKTAIAASDANWGRIVAAVGKAGEKANRDKLSIKIGGVVVAKNGGAAPSYKESQIAAHMQGREINIAVDVGVGKGKATVYTCDLTHRYIDINGSYRT